MGFWGFVNGIKDNFNIVQHINNLTGSTAQKNQEKAWERDDSTYQRTISDLEAAGINPSILFGGHGSTIGNSSPINPSSSLPSVLSGILSAVNESSRLSIDEKRANSEKEVNDSIVDKNKAEAENIRSKTTGQNIQNKLNNLYGSDEFKSRIESIEAQTSNTTAKTEEIENLLKQQKTQMLSDTSTVTMSKSRALALSHKLDGALKVFGSGLSTGLSTSISRSKSDTIEIPIGYVAIILNPNSSKDEVLFAAQMLSILSDSSGSGVKAAAATLGTKAKVGIFLDDLKEKASQGYEYIKGFFGQ